MQEQTRVQESETTTDFSFEALSTSDDARTGLLKTPHGVVKTPAFMPVATQGTIKGLSVDEVEAAGGKMMLSNAYHLYLRPGDSSIRALGGLHAFTRWKGPMLTDSGGFQVFSLAKFRTVSEAGVEFRSHIDGSLHQYSPESVMQIQRNIGADVIMQLDELVAGGTERGDTDNAMKRSLRWLERCRLELLRLERDEPRDLVQALFPIVQGGIYDDLRRSSIAGILDCGEWKGVAIGGLSVGEPKPDMYRTLDVCNDALPRDKPRYLMGVGFPEDLIEGVARGVDLFDCVVPTRMGRHGTAFTPDGTRQIRKSSYRMDTKPLVEGCLCPACTRYDRAYLRHLFAAGEMLGLRLLSLHNLTFLLRIMRDAREAINSDTFLGWSTDWLARYRAGVDSDASSAD